MINKSLDFIYSNVILLFEVEKKKTVSKNPKVLKTKNRTIMLLYIGAVCNSKKSNLIKEQQTGGLLSSLTGIKVPILSDLHIINTLF